MIATLINFFLNAFYIGKLFLPFCFCKNNTSLIFLCTLYWKNVYSIKIQFPIGHNQSRDLLTFKIGTVPPFLFYYNYRYCLVFLDKCLSRDPLLNFYLDLKESFGWKYRRYTYTAAYLFIYFLVLPILHIRSLRQYLRAHTVRKLTSVVEYAPLYYP